ncbi:hypothetical protein EUBSIR_00068 [[Eubacterium] siraeum DSM 15702]|uniref:Uncharacterized protein n=1 Tax=[Eubacterium] siraeum DSM 15702 TaxID=428128 RepID=B0MJU3_9FIRM|nr:hypothetical protein EUBSIR_00068 [[Eubacterium] siraeum DSM 15702]
MRYCLKSKAVKYDCFTDIHSTAIMILFNFTIKKNANQAIL